MGFRPYLRALRRRWLVWLMTTAIGLVVAAGVYALTPARYSSTVTFYVATTAASSGAVDTGQFAQSRVASYSEILSSDRVSQLVSRRSGVPIASVRGHLSSSYSQETVLVTGVVSGATPVQAQRMATALVEVFPPLVEALDNQNKNGVGVDVALVSGPQASDGPVFPVIWQFALAGLLAGLIVGVAVVLIRQAVRQPIVGAAEAEAATGLPVLAVVPEDPSVSQSWRPGPASPRAEAFRQLRAQVLAQQSIAHRASVGEPGWITDGRNGLVVAVVSAVDFEGRTQVAIGLADALAESSGRVLLTDADLRRPALAALTGLDAQPGLTDVLTHASATGVPAGQHAATGSADSPETLPAVVLSDSPLELLPAGTSTENASDLLAGDRLTGLLAAVRRDYDVAVIDTAPVTVADALIIAARADVTVLVVAENDSTRSAVLASVRTLRTSGAEVLGLVLNRHRPTRAERARHRQAVSGVSQWH